MGLPLLKCCGHRVRQPGPASLEIIDYMEREANHHSFPDGAQPPMTLQLYPASQVSPGKQAKKLSKEPPEPGELINHLKPLNLSVACYAAIGN